MKTCLTCRFEKDNKGLYPCGLCNMNFELKDLWQAKKSDMTVEDAVEFLSATATNFLSRREIEALNVLIEAAEKGGDGK